MKYSVVLAMVVRWAIAVDWFHISLRLFRGVSFMPSLSMM